jgi:hypothetical protein
VEAAVLHVARPFNGRRLGKEYVDKWINHKTERLREKRSELLWPYQRCRPMTYNPKYGTKPAYFSKNHGWATMAKADPTFDKNLFPAAEAMDQADAYYEVRL